ncbi:hypothetical protein LT493_41885 [Streptomyces tricolor]|nr:hypothetical protein [Streptomyces tricolor]
MDPHASARSPGPREREAARRNPRSRAAYARRPPLRPGADDLDEQDRRCLPRYLAAARGARVTDVDGHQ